MKKNLFLGILIIVIIFSNVFVNISYADEKKITWEELSDAIENLYDSGNYFNKSDKVEVNNDSILITDENNNKVEIKYDLSSKPTFWFETYIQKGMSYKEFEDKISKISLPEVGFFAICKIKCIEIEDAEWYYFLSALSSALKNTDANDSQESYVIIDDTEVSEGVTIIKDESDTSRTIYVSQFGDKVMEYVNYLYKDKSILDDADNLNLFEFSEKMTDVTDESCKIISKMIVNFDNDFSKLKGFAKKDDDYEIIGKMTIPAIDLETNIASNATSKSLREGVSLVYDSELNKIGNTVICGYNNILSNLKYLKIGDKIVINYKDELVEYEIYDFSEYDIDDTSYAERETNDREITLCTQNDDETKILVCFAKESVKKSTNIPIEAKSFKNHYYYIFEQIIGWKEAKKYCEEQGGHLVTITSEDEQDFIKSYIKDKNYSKQKFWIGATDEDDEGSWKWVTGEKFAYTNWGKGEPDNLNEIQHYALIQNYKIDTKNYAIDEYEWDDIDSQNIMFICEWDNGEYDLSEEENKNEDENKINVYNSNDSAIEDEVSETQVLDDITTSPSILPKTGVRKGILISIICLSIFGIIMFIKYRNLRIY